jgi:hypothetical protein
MSVNFLYTKSNYMMLHKTQISITFHNLTKYIFIFHIKNFVPYDSFAKLTKATVISVISVCLPVFPFIGME